MLLCICSPIVYPVLFLCLMSRRTPSTTRAGTLLPYTTLFRSGLRPYGSDGLTAYRQPPMIVVLPETVEQVSAILCWCHKEGVKVVPRGSGTSLSGGAQIGRAHV